MHPTPLQILSHIPGFVWAILVVILYFGIKQTSTTAMRAKRLVRRAPRTPAPRFILHGLSSASCPATNVFVEARWSGRITTGSTA